MPCGLIIGVIIGFAGLVFAKESQAIPAFAREYGVSCGTCHTAYPALNSNGEAFRLSGYRRFEGGGKAEPALPPLKIGDRLALPANIPLSFSLTAGYLHHRIDNSLGDGRSNTHDPEDEFRREQGSFELSSVEILAGATLGDHLSFFLDAPLAELEQRQFFDPEVRDHGAKAKIEGPEIPERVFAGFNDLFAPDLLNVMGGVIELPTAFSVESTRLSFFRYLIYEANALDVISRHGADHFISVPGAGEEDIEKNQFRLSTHQIGVEAFGRIEGRDTYFDYFLGGVN
ncbi:MAG: hypothetical protein ACREMO_00535, partial [Gemmatimonadales bacterium]